MYEAVDFDGLFTSVIAHQVLTPAKTNWSGFDNFFITELLIIQYPTKLYRWLYVSYLVPFCCREKIIQRRLVWLCGKWVSVKFSKDLRPRFYEALCVVLTTTKDIGIRLTAIIALKNDILLFLYSSFRLKYLICMQICNLCINFSLTVSFHQWTILNSVCKISSR